MTGSDTASRCRTSSSRESSKNRTTTKPRKTTTKNKINNNSSPHRPLSSRGRTCTVQRESKPTHTAKKYSTAAGAAAQCGRTHSFSGLAVERPLLSRLTRATAAVFLPARTTVLYLPFPLPCPHPPSPCAVLEAPATDQVCSRRAVPERGCARRSVVRPNFSLSPLLCSSQIYFFSFHFPFLSSLAKHAASPLAMRSLFLNQRPHEFIVPQISLIFFDSIFRSLKLAVAARLRKLALYQMMDGPRSG